MDTGEYRSELTDYRLHIMVTCSDVLKLWPFHLLVWDVSIDTMMIDSDNQMTAFVPDRHVRRFWRRASARAFITDYIRAWETRHLRKLPQAQAVTALRVLQ